MPLRLSVFESFTTATFEIKMVNFWMLTLFHSSRDNVQMWPSIFLGWRWINNLVVLTVLQKKNISRYRQVKYWIAYNSTHKNCTSIYLACFCVLLHNNNNMHFPSSPILMWHWTFSHNIQPFHIVTYVCIIRTEYGARITGH